MVPLEETSPFLVRILRLCGDEWGPLGVALCAAQLSDPRVVQERLDELFIDDPAPDPALWSCQVGEVPRASLPDGADGPMRNAVERAFKELTGFEPQYCFSGWGDRLTEVQRSVIEDRMPSLGGP